ncbi:AMP-dependent synthetase/ligase [Rhodoflexus caldus]|uniref:AMP-dependent synthetase/ligase n=1 Tax=Rhodoflexus caldus TaxID=2891236 RepID=UPI00202A4495|nr:long-chain fatty acid--CoA ligase [Rhodoflexus caldus]
MELKRAFDFLYYQQQKYPKTDALAGKENGQWVKYSTQDVIDIANRISIGLLKLGIKKDDKVAIISPNRPEWNLADFGIQQIGAVSVPMYPTITVEDYRYIFNDAGVKVVFVSDKSLYDKVKQATEGMDIYAIYTFDKLPGIAHWTELEAMGKNEDVSQLDSHKAAVKGTDLLTLIYTSGTTGRPKGVMLTHKNVVSNTLAVNKTFTHVPDGTSKALSFLPLCHIYERTGSYVYIYKGTSIYYAENMDTIAANLQEVKPDTFNTVPRLLEKVYDKIVSKGLELTGTKRKLFFWALDLGLKYDPAKDMGFAYNMQLSIARKLIFSKWQAALGGNIKSIQSGAAALQPRLARVFWAAGIPICEGYGLTETSPVISSTPAIASEVRIGCVGKMIDGVQVKIAEDGEILCKGDNVMLGYYNQPEMTAEVIKDGWFHTGDVGEIVEGKYLKITDRKKEMFKTSGGKYIAPQVMENKFKESLLIEQIIVVGEGRNFPSALIVPSFENLRNWCQAMEISYSTDAEMVKNPRVIAKFEEEVENYNANFGQWEKVKKFRLLPQPWGIETGELTPTLKLKRKIIHQKYANYIEEMYT